MEMLAREEANVRTAIQWAVEADHCDVAAVMVDAFHHYLRHSARLRELDRWLAWLAEMATQTKFSELAAAVEQERAQLLFTQGYTAEAIRKLEALIERLRHTTEFAPAFQLAHAQMELGRIYTDAGHADRAIPLLTDAVSAWEQLVKQAANLSPSETLDDLFKSDEQEVKLRRETCVQPLVNLVATISDLANALRKAGRLNDALSRAEQVVKISRTIRLLPLPPR
jgi:tetratricopeptide (TPR) repeat protein